ncbi:hypothetical protein HMPREF3033_01511 [Veillonellaceae bacterium DNF00751]|uniref:Uncharacterized protein n=1 Tax=Megasphaera lornae TaxID=1000568 RepID=D3LW56_9FIRM|nr:hypothetical protein HMPREF0889_1197 [Megasphaera genomosp. type_1 str. 28L]KXB90335.1 hypothetical protein HMPREF3033_01511 [Veillonellaceae bacterium DNF00751]
MSTAWGGDSGTRRFYEARNRTKKDSHTYLQEAYAGLFRFRLFKRARDGRCFFSLFVL